MSDRYTFPNGIYQLEVMESSAATNVNGKDYLSLKCKVVAAKKVDSDEEVKIGYYANLSLFLTPAAKEYTERFLRHVGFYEKATSLAQLSTEHPDYISLEGIRFDSACKTKDNGYNDWLALVPKTSQQSSVSVTKPKPASLAKLKALDGQFGMAKKPTDIPMPPPAATASAAFNDPWGVLADR